MLYHKPLSPSTLRAISGALHFRLSKAAFLLDLSQILSHFKFEPVREALSQRDPTHASPLDPVRRLIGLY